MTATAGGTKGTTHRFGDFSFDARTGELGSAAGTTRLSPHLASLLETLIASPGELVTRETLRTRLWPADTFVDFEHGLTAAVNKLREALGDDAHRSVFIETIPRRGYRWLMPVGGVQHELEHGTAASAETPPRHGQVRRLARQQAGARGSAALPFGGR